MVTVSTGVVPLTMSEEGKTITDPHIWQDPAQVKLMVNNIAAALVKADPAGASAYQQRADAYQKTTG